MVEGILKKDLEKKREELVKVISESEVAEKENSGKMHQAIAEKNKLKIQIVDSKNQLVQLDELITSCKEFGITSHITAGLRVT